MGGGYPLSLLAEIKHIRNNGFDLALMEIVSDNRYQLKNYSTVYAYYDERAHHKWQFRSIGVASPKHQAELLFDYATDWRDTMNHAGSILSSFIEDSHTIDGYAHISGVVFFDRAIWWGKGIP